MTNNAFIITLAYPETVVTVSNEWFLKYMRYFGIGKKDYVRAGHAAMVLIHKETGILEYYDFGRYITPIPTGRVRSKETDHELDFLLKVVLKNEHIDNLDDILKFLATHPNFTHGTGTLYASVCDEVNYENTKKHISQMQEMSFIRYAAFLKESTNCARFVNDALIVGITNPIIKKRLIKSKWFTPSPIGNVVLADSKNKVYKVSETGEMSNFNSSISKEHSKLFLDRLKDHKPNLKGTLEAKLDVDKHNSAQWLPGIGSGAWFELHDLNQKIEYRFRRVSPQGNVDVDGIYKISDDGFDITSDFAFTHHSNCKLFHIEQNDILYRFDFLRKHE